MDVPEDVSDVFRLALQNQNAITERDSSVDAKPDALEQVHVVEETAAALLTGWTLEKIDLVCQHEEGRTMADRLNTKLMPLRNKFLATRLCNPSFWVLKTHLLSSGLGGGSQVVSMSKALIRTLRSSVNTILWL